jgi:hypothetical protein
MPQEDPLDTTLAELHQAFSDILTMLNIVMALCRNSAHLLALLRCMLADLSQHLERALPTLPNEEG